MKIEIAVYTAQEGYSWQPGTKITAQELRDYKTCIGKFPSPDSSSFPFGGIFLKDDKVVFYRYHVAKRIDFRGRDALYCVLGAVPKAEAAQVDPKAIFALPEFAGVVKPFPTQAELPSVPPEAVPEWLKNLDRKILDVRITGTVEKMDCAVTYREIPPPPPPQPVLPLPPQPIRSPSVPQVPVVGGELPGGSDLPETGETGESAKGVRGRLRRHFDQLSPILRLCWMITIGVALLDVVVLVYLAVMWLISAPKPVDGESSGTNGVGVTSQAVTNEAVSMPHAPLKPGTQVPLSKPMPPSQSKTGKPSVVEKTPAVTTARKSNVNSTTVHSAKQAKDGGRNQK